MAERSVALRLGVKGGTEVRSELKGIETAGTAGFGKIGDAAEASARRASRAVERAATDAEAAQAKLARATARLAAFTPQTGVQMRVNDAVGTGYSQPEGSARLSAQAFLAADRARQVYDRGLVQTTARSGQAGQGMRQLSFQLNDLATQYAAGTSASIIFAQQSGQVIQALQLMGGEGNKVLRWLGGWQAMLLTTVAVAMTPFIAKLFEESQASKAAKKALEEHRNAALDLADAQGKALRTSGEQLRMTRDQTAANYAAALSTREQVAAELERARVSAQEALNISRSGRGAAEAATVTGPILQRLREIEERAGKNASDVTRLQSGADNAQRQYQRYLAQQNSTPEGRLGLKYEGLTSQADRIVDDGARQRRYDELIKLRQQEEEVIRKSAAALRGSVGSRVAADRSSELLDAAKKYRGLNESRDKDALGSLFSAAGVSIDPEKVAWCAAFVNAVLAQNGVKGSGSLSARSFLGVGQATSKPTAGDLVVLRRGNDPKAGHVGFYEGTDAQGRIRVLGGNTGNKVGTQAFDAKDVLGFRKVSDGARDYADAVREAKQELDRLTSLRDSLLGMYDEEGRAAEELAKRLRDLGVLRDKGLISEGQRADMAVRARLQAFEVDASPPPNGDAVIRSVGIDPDAPLVLPDLAQTEARAEAIRQSIVPIIDAMDVLKQRGADAIDAITDPSNWNDMGSLAKSVIQSILRDLMTLAVANPLKNLLGITQSDGSPFSVLGGLGSLFGGKGNGIVSGDNTVITGSVLGGILKGLPKLASGTSYAMGGATLVGELGPELVDMPRGSRVHTAAQTRQMMARGSSPSINMPITINASNADREGLLRVEAEVRKLRAEGPGMAVAAVANARARRMIPA